MDPKRIQLDLARIDRRLTELDKQRANTRDIEAEALNILRRPKTTEENSMAVGTGGYMIGRDGQRRDFNRDGTEIRTGPQQSFTQPTLGMGSGTPNITRPQPSTPNLAASIQRPDADMNAGPRTPHTVADARSPSNAIDLASAIQRPGASAGASGLVRGTSIPFDEAVRRAENAMSSARVRSPAANTRSAMQRHYDAAAGMRDFWLDQARSVPGGAQRMAEHRMQADSAERIASGNNATALQRGAADNAAQIQATQMQQAGAMDRLNAREQAALRRPQPPTQLGDGTLARIGEDGQMVPYTMPDGSVARGIVRPQEVNQSALARLTGDLSRQLSGIDEYGQVADESTENGYRPATQEERENAFRNAARLARETLSGHSSTPASEPRQSASSAPARGRPTSLQEFLERSRSANPGVSDEELVAYFNQTYGAR